MYKTFKMRQAVILALTVLLACLLPLYGTAFRPVLTANAVSADYPVPLYNLASKDNSKVLTVSGMDDMSSLSMAALGGDLSPSWRIDRVGKDSNGTFFKFINAKNGRLLTPLNYNVRNGESVVSYGSESAKSQHWYIIPVSKDHLGNDLYYKIVNYSDTTLALTQGTSGMTLSSYTGADNQLFLLNADGLQGFAGYCTDDDPVAAGATVKAGDIGGLFGEVVEASTFSELKKYAESSDPYTILVTKNISVTDLNFNQTRYMCTAGRIYVEGNKTIVGSYGAHTLFNVQFCTKRHSTTSNNIIIKNFDMQHDAESNHNDSIVCYFSAGENLWVDHVTFTGHSNYGYAPQTKQVDEDKFLACCYDADYCTISDCSFGGHKYGLILGYPDDTAEVKNTYDNFPRMTLISNRFDDTNTRGPGLMRWGYFHSLNNYVNKFSMAYTVHSGCDIYAESCVYENGGNVICDWNSITFAGAYAESGSKFSNCQRTVQGQGTQSNPATSKPSYWRPNTNYTYKALSADDAKNYCMTYSGCQSGSGKIAYTRLASAGVPSAGYTELPSGPMKPAAVEFKEGSTYIIKNAGNGSYLSLGIGTGLDPYIVQLPEDIDGAAPPVWKFHSAGDGYYYLALGDEVINVPNGSKADETGLNLADYAGSADQQFKFIADPDGTYTILTKVTDDGSALETLGSIVAQNKLDENSTSQKWKLIPSADNGCVMDTDLIYTFKNVNSGLVMDIENGSMENGTNVRQWESNGFDCQKWKLTRDTNSPPHSARYYIRSLQDESFALRAEGNKNGANIDIAPFSVSDENEIFVFSLNLDGTYSILSRASDSVCLVEVEAAQKDGGANIQQYENTGSPCQYWEAVTETVTTTTTTTTTTTSTTTTTLPEFSLSCEKTELEVGEAIDVIIENWDGDISLLNPTAIGNSVVLTQYHTPRFTVTAISAGESTVIVRSSQGVEKTIVFTVKDRQPEITPGDANCDTQINMADAVFIMQTITNPDKYKLTDKGEKNADVDNSGDITNKDALKIQKFKLGLIASLS